MLSNRLVGMSHNEPGSRTAKRSSGSQKIVGRINNGLEGNNDQKKPVPTKEIGEINNELEGISGEKETSGPASSIIGRIYNEPRSGI